MDSELKKKLLIPFLVFVGLLALNANSIINAINQHQTSRVIIASASSVFIIIAFIVVIRSVKKNNNKTF
ncbi:hypothetical protein [Mucilaginibacter paludis]|uniref:Uncharacterized protein n=1 Tax=Mucilaginibacter paludis DSM 18603 TaxID=714943 RepID=H1XZW7_9SPHI|nr:hypothetical protein [Mucilaginibacter paludis]EHQ27809.1 hypothetical protein Mucpa_3711 [Mucilaginibacter paludis DSM 18603]